MKFKIEVMTASITTNVAVSVVMRKANRPSMQSFGQEPNSDDLMIDKRKMIQFPF